MPQAQNNRVGKGQHEQDQILLALWIMFGAVALGLWVLLKAFEFRRPQVLEVEILLLLSYYLVVNTVTALIKRSTLRESLWPKPRLMYSESRDRKYMKIAAERDCTLLGYEDNGKPVFWTDDQRAMQTNVPGMSGAGKSTLLYNVLEQDIRRGKTVVFLDGKGEKEFVIKLMAAAIAAGRADDIRLIDPTHPDKSSKYNPFYAPSGDLNQRVDIVFESLGANNAKDQFFAEHQKSFLRSLCNVLSFTGRTLTFQSIAAAAQKPDYVMETIASVHDQVMNDPNLKPYVKDAFQAHVTNLRGIYSENDWLGKIRGLINSMMPFVGDDVSQITDATENLLTIEDVVEKNLILLVTMNIPKNSAATTTVGRIILRDLQSIISKRYDDYSLNKKHSFLSIVLDEFGLFAYVGFSKIIHTARQANASFIFSFQNINQLAGDVGQSFAHDVSTATNCSLLMKLRDNDSAENFTKASGSVRVEKVSYQVEREAEFAGMPYQETGRGTRSHTYETRILDHHLKQLPTGQMMAFLSDRQMGSVVKHVHVRKPLEYFMPSFVPAWYVSYATSAGDSNRLNIKFTLEEPGRKANSGRRARK
jgi:type IV secretory pathway TraG/TraD family ATPase VirD4